MKITDTSIQKVLGRIPNKDESQFLTAFLQSVSLQNTYQRETEQILTQSSFQSPLMLITQGNQDVRGQMAVHILNAKNGTKINAIKTTDGSVLIGKVSSENNDRIPENGKLYFLKGTKQESIVNALEKMNLIMKMIAIPKSGLGHGLFTLLDGNKCGILLNKSVMPYISSKRGHGILIHVDKRSTSDLKANASLHQKLISVGSIIRESTINIAEKDQSIGHLPLQLLRMMANYDRSTDEIKMQIETPKYDLPSIKEKKSYHNELKELLADIPKRSAVSIISKKGEAYGYATHTNDYIRYEDYEMGAIAAITNGARHLICRGIRPEVATGFLSLPKGNVPEKGSFLKGVKMAGNALNITMDHFAFDDTTDKPLGQFYVAGQRIIHSDFPSTFQSSDQFISILGSHRGELGGSRYLSLQKMDNKGAKPAVDLTMESRLQDAVLTGIHSGLIQSALPIGRGGIATTIGRSFSKSSIGARIHFSRKLTVPELLFGETQGLVLVTIDEMDLMEFERVCMNIGVPATTIGRVTNNGLYTFNEFIKLSVDSLLK